MIQLSMIMKFNHILLPVLNTKINAYIIIRNKPLVYISSIRLYLIYILIKFIQKGKYL